MKRFVNGDEAELLPHAFHVHLVGDRWMVRTPEGSFSAFLVRQNSTSWVSFKGHQYRVEQRQARRQSAGHIGTGELHAMMPGQIVDVRLAEGDFVKKGDTILVLEAMKTQQGFAAPFDGQVTKICVGKGDQVKDGALLAVVEARSQVDD